MHRQNRIVWNYNFELDKDQTYFAENYLVHHYCKLCSGYANIIDDNIISDSYYEKVGGDNKNPLDVGNDGYIQKNKKTEKFDNDYERMMSERSELMNQIK